MIVVTGATGQLGRLVIAELLERVPASESSQRCVTSRVPAVATSRLPHEGIAEGQLSRTDATLRERPSIALTETLSEVVHEASIPHAAGRQTTPDERSRQAAQARNRNVIRFGGAAEAGLIRALHPRSGPRVMRPQPERVRIAAACAGTRTA